MAQAIMTLKGTNGTLTLYDDKVVIDRSNMSFLNAIVMAPHGLSHNRTIYLDQITGINIGNALDNILTNGYIQFTLADSPITKRVDQVRSDNNAVAFAKTHKGVDNNKVAHKIKEEIEKHRIVKTQPIIHAQQDGPDQLRKYKQLFDDNIITKEEYEAKKREILGL